MSGEIPATMEHITHLVWLGKMQVCKAKAHLTDLRNSRDQVYRQSWNYIVRLRAGIKGIYGDDSSQYQVVGGTRRSDCNPRSRWRKPQPGEALQAESEAG